MKTVNKFAMKKIQRYGQCKINGYIVKMEDGQYVATEIKGDKIGYGNNPSKALRHALLEYV